MAEANPHFSKLPKSYLFPIIEEKLDQLRKKHPNETVLNLGVGDVALPLAPTIARAIAAATLDMTQNVRGYGPCEGLPLLRETICANEYAPYGLTSEEIFVSDGANSDASGIQELFAENSTVLITDPTYPVYLDANLIAGKNVHLHPTYEKDSFIPIPPEKRYDLVYLCTPCNPTGVALTRDQLQVWIDWAKTHRAILIIDNVYNGFITSPNVPSSIYELPGGQEVAIELRSFSKTAGFTGLRCAYCVVPQKLHIPNLQAMWARRVNAKTNGVAYPIQMGALATYTPDAQAEITLQLATYKTAAKTLRESLTAAGHTYYGGLDSPYIFWKTPENAPSWSYFDQLLNEAYLIAIPGSGFGKCGEGFMRLSCFLTPETAKLAGERLCAMS